MLNNSMQLIRTITEEDFGRVSNFSVWPTFTERVGVRAIIIDDDGRIALMRVTKKGYYKLPGGGVDPGETLDEALKRELLEEAGIGSFDIVSEIGRVDGYHEDWGSHSKHFCYQAKLTGLLGDNFRTDKEIEQGYEVEWADNIDDAIKKVENGRSTDYAQTYEILRELTFLRHFKGL